jgi:hypothetical protein
MSYPDTDHDTAYCRAYEHIIAAKALAEAHGGGLLSDLLEQLDEDVVTMSRQYATLRRTMTKPTYRVERLSTGE